MAGNPPPIGFEMQGADPANISQINVGFNQPQPEVSPSQPLYPNPHDNTEVPMPPPIGFEGQVTDQNGTAEDQNNLNPQEKVPVSDTNSIIEEVVNENATLFFKDKKRKIDYVLAFEDEQDEKKKERRRQFEENLQEEGLQLEIEPKENSINKKTNFVKIHAPWDVLAKYAEITNMKMPLMENDMDDELTGIFDYCLSYIPSPFELSKDIIQDEPNYFTAPFNRERVNQFIIKDKDTFFTNAQRSKIVYEILARTWFEHDKKGKKRIGVSNLVSNGTYTAFFSLHDGRYMSEHSILTTGKENDRHEG